MSEYKTKNTVSLDTLKVLCYNSNDIRVRMHFWGSEFENDFRTTVLWLLHKNKMQICLWQNAAKFK